MIKQINGFDKYYISDSGEVFKKNKSGKLKKVTMYENHAKYKRVGLFLNGKRKWKFVHRLVIEAFLGFEENKQVNHKDGNKHNNCIDNLEWVTPSENIKHSIETGLKNFDYCSKSVVAVDLKTGVEQEFKSLREAERVLGVYTSDIAKVCKGKRKSAGGYTWKYKKEGVF